MDHSRVDSRLGGEEGRQAMTRAATDQGLGVVVDLVPNHMAISVPANRWFWDVLEHGPAGRFAGHFDVDWDPPDSNVHNKVLLPLLGDHYGRDLEAGAIRLEHDRGRFRIHYHDHVFPASPRSVAMIMGDAGRRSGSDELAFVARALEGLPPASTTDAEGRRRRHADAAVLAGIVTELAARPSLEKAIDATVEAVNADPDSLDRFLEAQNYRLARWRVAGQELGYRRFFDIDDMIGLRVEDPSVFADSHRLVLDWVTDGEVDGLRIDHPDGLRRPSEYLRRLREAAPDAWIVVEKILEGEEQLPDEWPVDGTTGYEFLNDLTALLVDPTAEDAFTDLWKEMAATAATWDEVAEEAKRDVVRDVLAADLNRLTAVFLELVEARRRYRDFTRIELFEALTEILVAFDVYRTYVPEQGRAGDADRSRIQAAVAEAKRVSSEVDPELLDLLGGVLAGDLDGTAERELKMRFQQLSGPVMAKGVEDTAFYRYLRLAALCEVGGDPGRFGLADPTVLHRQWARTARRWPNRMLSLSTHDTKRSEDVRARLATLTEIPEQWAETVRGWREHNHDARPEGLDGATEYLIYQTMVGAHPIGADRLIPYLEKATKEAKVNTSWTDPDAEYDGAVTSFVRAVTGSGAFRRQVETFVETIRTAGWVNSLAQKVVQLTAPGVPDIYQGTELWDLSLVDPDNRRPVDHRLRERLLIETADMEPTEILSRMDDGLPKLWVVRLLLELRRRRPSAFDGEHAALAASGPAADHIFSFLRGGEVCVVVPRLTLRLEQAGRWRDTRLVLPGGDWDDVFTGVRRSREVLVEDLLSGFPVSVLERT